MTFEWSGLCQACLCCPGSANAGQEAAFSPAVEPTAATLNNSLRFELSHMPDEFLGSRTQGCIIASLVKSAADKENHLAPVK